MPELPEVETMRSGLEMILGPIAQIQTVTLMRADIRFKIPKSLPAELKGQRILGVRRRAKYLLFDTPTVSLLSQLGMTGSWRIEKPGDRDKHDHCLIALTDGRTLVFRDPRRFGVIDLIHQGQESTHKLLKHLGPEPLDEMAFKSDVLYAKSRKRKVSVKVFIMDQKVVVGVGNIYASEVLFRAKVSPLKKSGRLTRLEVERIVAAIRDVLKAAISAGGSSIRDYRQAGGESGAFQDAHLVYDRKGEPCLICGTPIRMRVLGGRSTFWCPSCQST